MQDFLAPVLPERQNQISAPVQLDDVVEWSSSQLAFFLPPKHKHYRAGSLFPP
jgi:hypothetical protein